MCDPGIASVGALALALLLSCGRDGFRAPSSNDVTPHGGDAAAESEALEGDAGGDDQGEPLPPKCPVELALGSEHACVIRSDGSVACWGRNGAGELGNSSGGATSSPVAVPSLASVAEIVSDKYHTCAIETDGDVWCWGMNDHGQLGGTPAMAGALVEVAAVKGAKRLAAGRGHTCAALGSQLLCWGDNRNGQLGDGTFDSSVIPVPVVDLQSPTAEDAGSSTVCAVDSSARVWCWGRNDYGQVGDGSTTRAARPLRVDLTGIVEVATNGWGQSDVLHTAQTCVRRDDLTVWCWGSNDRGQLGDGTFAQSFTPVQATGISDAIDLTMGRYHVCVLRTDGSVACWGGNDFGQVGVGSLANVGVPTPITGLTDVVVVVAGGWFTCALERDGDLHCWGDNSSGQLGDGTTTQRTSPVQSLQLCP